MAWTWSLCSMTEWPRCVTLSPILNLLQLQNLHDYSFLIFSGFTACLTRLSWTVTWYLLQISGLRSLLSSKSTLTNLQCSILKQMVKLNGWIKHLKRTFGSFATMNKMIDLNYCHLLSLLTIMVCKNPLRYHLSSVISAGWAKLATNQRPTGFCLILYQIGLQLLQSK